MPIKATSAIEKITVNEGTLDNEIIKPNYINVFYGKNGAGKTSISRESEAGRRLVWADGKVPSNYQILVYSQNYIDLHFKTLDKVHGIKETFEMLFRRLGQGQHFDMMMERARI